MPIAALLALLFVLGTLSALAGGARVALVRSTVPDAAYVPARSLMKIAARSPRSAGNALGGALVVVAGTSGAILVNAATFALAFAARPVPGRRPRQPGRAGRGRAPARLAARRPRDLRARAARAPDAARLARADVLGRARGARGAVRLGAPRLAAARRLVARRAAGRDDRGRRRRRPLPPPGFQRRLVGSVAAAGFVPYLVFGFDPPVAAALVLLVALGRVRDVLARPRRAASATRRPTGCSPGR